MLFDLGVFVLVVGATVLMLVAIAHQSIRKPHWPRSKFPAVVLRQGRGLMEIVLALGIGVLDERRACGWSCARTFQVMLGLSLLSYAVNLFIVATGRLGGRGADRWRLASRCPQQRIRCRRRSS